MATTAGSGGHPVTLEPYVRVPAAWTKIRQAVRRGEYVALVGAKYCGKTLLLRDLLHTLDAEGDCSCAYVDLEGWQVYRPQGLFQNLASAILQAIPGVDATQIPMQAAGVHTGPDLRDFLISLLPAVPHSVVVALDHVESLPNYLARAMLTCFRVVFSERLAHPEYERLIVVAAGALNLFELTATVISPFNIATVVSIPDADKALGRQLVEQVAARLGVAFSAGAVDRILGAAGGDAYLIQRLCRLAAAQPVWTVPKVATPAVERALAEMERTEPADNPCLAGRIQLVEADPVILKTVLDVLAGQEVRRRALLTDVDSAELTGVVKVVGHRYVMRSQVCGAMLRRYFTPRRVARLFSSYGRWDEAIRYFEQSDLSASAAERAEYLAAVVNRIYGDGDEEAAFEGLAEALVQAFGVRQLAIHRSVEEGRRLVPVAWRGLPGYRDGSAFDVLADRERPEVRAYGGGEFLLERDDAGASLLLIPLPSGSRLPAVGVVTLCNHFAVERYAERREEVLEMAGFTAQAGRAIASQRERQALLRREQQRVEALTGLNDVARAIMVVRELEDLLEMIVERAREVLPADVVTLYLYNDREQRFHTPLGAGLRDPAGFRRASLPQAEGQIAGRIVRERRPLFFENAARHPAAERIAFVAREEIRSIAGFPLLRADEPVGVLFVGYRSAHQFSDDERQIISAFADHAAISIENADLYRRLAADHTTLASLYQVTTRLRTSLVLSEVLEAITGSLQNLYDLATCTVGLLDPTEERLDFIAHLGLEGPVVRRVQDLPSQLWITLREDGERVFVADLGQFPELAAQLERPDLQAFAILPLQGRARFLGILTMGSTQRLTLEASDWALITALASQAAVAIENAQLHDEVRQAYGSLEDTLKILTHQLRAEPAFVSNTLSTLLAGRLGPLSERQRDRLLKAQHRLDEHHHLISSLNMYGRLKGGRLRPRQAALSLNPVVQDVADRYRRSARWKGLTLEMSLGALPPVEMDEDMIRIVVMNLLDNAFKFTPREGRVRVETWADGTEVHLAVDDTGPGIPVEEWERVFEEYHQVESIYAEKGSGLGLYIVRRLVEMQGGWVAVVAKEGPGARLQVTLPA